MEQKLIQMQKEIVEFTIGVEDFNTYLSSGQSQQAET